MSTTELFLIAMLIIFSVPFLVWRFGRTDNYAPLVVVQTAAGVLLGPGVLGALFPAYYSFVFTPQVVQSLNGIGWWAVMVFIMLAGIELDVSAAWRNRRDTVTTAACALGVPLLLGCAAAAVLLTFAGFAGANAAPWQFILGVGMACSVTALPVLMLLMDKMEVTRHQIGQRVLRYASIDDIAIWGVLAIILLDFERIGRELAFLVVFAGAALLVRRVMARAAERDRLQLALIWMAACSLAADWAGLHFMVGAFLSGAVLEKDWFEEKRMDMLRQHLLVLVLPVYFLSTGLKTHWDGAGAAVLGAAAMLLLVSVGGKLAGTGLAGALLKWEKGEATVIGWLLQTKGLVMIIFANILLDKGIISNASFTALLLMSLGSTMLTGPVVAPRFAALRTRLFAPRLVAGQHRERAQAAPLRDASGTGS